MVFFLLEAILCVSHVIFNEKIIFCYLNRVPPNLISAPSTEHTLNSLHGSSPWRRPFGEPPERQKLVHDGCSEPAYDGLYPDCRPSRSTAYTGLHPDGDPSGSLLKDGGSLTLDARSQPIMGYTLMAARAGQPPTRVFTLTATLRRAF